MKDYVIIVAAGSGSRMKAALPKQFIDLKGKPVLLHTLEKFHRFNPTLEIIVVLNAEYVQFWKDLAITLKVTIPHTVVSGGDERFFSVLKGLADKNGIVGIHDAVRPLVSMKTLETCYSVARSRSNAIPVMEIPDSLRQVNENGSQVANRNLFRIVQTPQCFELSLIRKAFQQPYQASFTDDASVVENLGVEIHLVEGNRENFKITTPGDLSIAEAII